ncbi:MAG: C40 family peptidase [Muribaculaceae bacterium]|nr:C40 family peptidase [Muribaculaceae bacterium]
MNKSRLSIWLIALCLLTGACHSSRKSVSPASDSAKGQSVWTGQEKSSEAGRKLSKAAHGWLGTKYKYGGETKGGADCSGMVMSLYLETLGIKLPRNSARQQEFCRRIDVKELAEGDLVFFSSSKGGGRGSHVGRYGGEGRFIHASTSRGGIKSSLSEPYYASHFHSAGRVPAMSKAAKAATIDKPQAACTRDTSDPARVPEVKSVPSLATESLKEREVPEIFAKADSFSVREIADIFAGVDSLKARPAVQDSVATDTVMTVDEVISILKSFGD